ncbi:hypothetical protein BJ742DRAFT_740199 [Cladochytrium replicatum]|nr:hypothetical protein BJ742DRAFT_740199 [Cladochytrium replicatum]
MSPVFIALLCFLIVGCESTVVEQGGGSPQPLVLYSPPTRGTNPSTATLAPCGGYDTPTQQAITIVLGTHQLLQTGDKRFNRSPNYFFKAPQANRIREYDNKATVGFDVNTTSTGGGTISAFVKRSGSTANFATTGPSVAMTEGRFLVNWKSAYGISPPLAVGDNVIVQLRFSPIKNESLLIYQCADVLLVVDPLPSRGLKNVQGGIIHVFGLMDIVLATYAMILRLVAKLWSLVDEDSS